MNFLPITKDIVTRYLNYIGLEKLRKSGNNWYCKCPYCKRNGEKVKDSKFYILCNNERVTVYCHKCGTSKSFYKFLEEFSPSVLESIKAEIYLGKKPDISTAPVKVEEKIVTGIEAKLKTRLRNHPESLAYAQKRKLPEDFIDTLYFEDNYVDFLFQNMLIEVAIDKKRDPRIVIPYVNENGEWTHIQGRTILPNDKLRYLTITLIENEPKIWGLDRINKSNTVYVTEGVFDAIYVKNGIAFGSAYADPEILKRKGIKDVVYCLDHDIETNVALRKAATKYLDTGARLFFFPKSISSECKDFNDLILKGWTKERIMELIESNTFGGLAAKAKLAILGGTRC